MTKSTNPSFETGFGESRATAAPSAGRLATVAVPPVARNRAVLIYIALALLSLVPGLVGKSGIDLGALPLAGQLVQILKDALGDIRFGAGLRFWLGVAGATMMGLLLLYPLRKAFARNRLLGSVGAWFHVHMLFGLFGPVLVLYHCNFGRGATDSNVALVSMLVVVVSGIVGHFVYARVSAGFYGDKRKVRDLLDDLIVGLRGLEGLQPARQGMIERLERFEARMLAPRKGVMASLMARMRSSVHRHQFHHDLNWILGNCAREHNWSAAVRQQRGRHLNGLMKSYMDGVTQATGRSVLEQLWARWRLFHLPVFLVMVVAVVLHVIAVWGMDSGPRAAAPGVGQASVEQASVENAGLESSRVQSGGDGVASAAVSTATPTAPPRPPAADKPQQAAAKPQDPDRPSRGVTGGDVLARLSIQPHEIAAPPRKPAAEPPKKPLVRTQPGSPPLAEQSASNVQTTAAKPAPSRSAAPPPPKSEPVAAQAEPNAVARVPADAKPTVAGSTGSGIESVLSELKQRFEQPPSEPPMALGGSRRVLSLAERISELKAQKFDHATTRFPLTGKHRKNDCVDCHKTTLENTPRDCVACHKNDDIHNDRRNDCAQCHTTNRWSQIIKK